MKNELYKSTMTYGLYVGIALAVVISIFHLFGVVEIPGSKSELFISIVLIFSMLFFGRKYQQTHYPNGISYGQSFRFLTLIIIFSTLIYIFFLFLYYSFIAPEAISIYLEQVEQVFNELMTTDEEQAKVLNETYRALVTPGVMAFSMGFKQIISGLFMNLIISFFIKTPLNLSR